MNLSDLVKDWGGFEELVKKIHQDGEVTVKRKKVPGHFGKKVPGHFGIRK